MLVTYAVAVLLFFAQYCHSATENPCEKLIAKKKQNAKSVFSSINVKRVVTFPHAFKPDGGLLSKNSKFCFVPSSDSKSFNVWSTLKGSDPVFTLSKIDSLSLKMQLKNKTLNLTIGNALIASVPYILHTDLNKVKFELDNDGSLKLFNSDRALIFNTRPSCDALLMEAREENDAQSYIEAKVPAANGITTIYVGKPLLSPAGKFCSFMTINGYQLLSNKNGKSDEDFLIPLGGQGSPTPTKPPVVLNSELDLKNSFSLCFGGNCKSIEQRSLTDANVVRLSLYDNGELKLLAASNIVWSSHGLHQSSNVTTHLVQFEGKCTTPPPKHQLQQNQQLEDDSQSWKSQKEKCVFRMINKTCGIQCDNNWSVLKVSDCKLLRMEECLLTFVQSDNTMHRTKVPQNVRKDSKCYAELYDDAKISFFDVFTKQFMWQLDILAKP